ncbi:glycerophosphodiester phosphodiesterase [Jeotgalibacillus campisalis]|uniref:Glycerophosphodiester phosphodiesterase n=1 Tax=Jeotgalibacillus campisalis TaxID=220754 RepID=A0A0C2VVY3_9BACL|nr:glycerophosphodiester phosphodiesterase family protein [Jeotgalibacillus campisalis]KIL53027.1 glycerophosphodiester phosphodiesterase [Jeotgalibacillus campisalis]
MKEMWKKTIVPAVSVIAICILFLAGHSMQSVKHVELEGMITVAHRGASGFAPENTQAAFQKGLELGADFLECDVQLTKDNELILIHDLHVDRTTDGQGRVRDYTLEELKRLDAGTSFHPSFAGETLITLDELLRDFYGKIGILIEVKNPAINKGIEEKIVELLEDYPDRKSIIVQSFDVNALKRIHELNKDIQLGVLINGSFIPMSTKYIDELASFATFINFNVTSLDKRTVDEIRKRDCKVLVWSKKDKRLIQKAILYGADGVITDFSRWPVDQEVYMEIE